MTKTGINLPNIININHDNKLYKFELISYKNLNYYISEFGYHFYIDKKNIISKKNNFGNPVKRKLYSYLIFINDIINL